MISDRNTDRFCLGAIMLAVLIAIGVLAGSIFFSREEEPENNNKKQTAYLSTDYADIIFDDSFVHEIDLQMPAVNWDYLVRNAEEEQYVLCNALIDGELVENVAIRPKGNSSLTAIKSQGSDRFSFKLEFDHYRKTNTYHGLDKLALNNLGQDVSCMKDYLSYHMMNEIGIPAPLSSYAQVKLNGEPFGLYLAVEAIEDSFAYRNYGDDFGNLYKPESFAIETITPETFLSIEDSPYGEDNPMEKDYTVLGPGDRVDILGSMARGPFEMCFGELMEPASLKYIGEDLDQYRVFFDASVFSQTKSDQESLVSALKKLNSSDNPQEAIDLDSVIRYFIVHNIVNNYDGYTGIFVHNYYLREHNGKISMIPWDYNLSCGIFTFESAIKSILGENSPYTVNMQVGNAMDDKTSMINYPIDTPTFTVSVEDRPLLAAILKNDRCLEQYHEVFREFLDFYFASGKFEEEYQKLCSLITPYVKQAQTFYSDEQFEKASEAVHEYYILREESIRRQLDGTLPATLEGQKEDFSNLVDASHVNLASSVTFDSLIFGIRSQDVIEILDAIAGEQPHTSEGVTKVIADATADPSQIVSIAGRVLKSSRFLKNTLRSAVTGPVLFVLSLILLMAARKWIMGYSRLKQPYPITEKKRKTQKAAKDKRREG
ncbi:MAG: CotH kinase family protein [Blautia sp.]|nr:CotH kinase family protein [Blautia sp.]